MSKSFQMTPCGDISTQLIETQQTRAIELRHCRTNERILLVAVVGRDELTVSTKDQKISIKIPEKHKGWNNAIANLYDLNCHTPLGDMAFEWCDWQKTQIPPKGVVGWISLCVAQQGPVQLVTISVGEDGQTLVASICSDIAHPRPDKYVTLCGRKASELLWTQTNG